jgi:hypothetical protein
MTTVELRSLRASKMAAVVFCFLFMLRASTLVSVKAADLSVVNEQLRFTEHVRKSKKPQRPRQFVVPLRDSPLARALARFIQARGFPILNSTTSPFAFGPGTPAKLLDAYIRDVIPVWASEHSKQLSHSLRRGAAVAAHALGVNVERILSIGGWSSSDSLRPYLTDRVWTSATREDSDCFAWMLA